MSQRHRDLDQSKLLHTLPKEKAMSTDKERNALAKAYPGWSWHEKVAGWSNEQVIAVYLRFERDGWPNVEPKIDPDLKPPEDPKPDKPDDNQFRLF